MTVASWQSLQISEADERKGSSTLWIDSGGAIRIPHIQIWQTKFELSLRVKIPHIAIESLEIAIASETILLRGEQQEPDNLPGYYYDVGFVSGQFESLIPLPSLIQPHTAKATINDCILVVTARKSPQMRRHVKLEVLARSQPPLKKLPQDLGRVRVSNW
jgi:HSP20 family protein